MKAADICLLRKARLEFFLCGLLALGIFTLLLAPSPGQAYRSGSTARTLFTLTEGDFLNPLLSSARAVTVLNCTAQQFAHFAGYDDFSTRVQINKHAQVVNVTRYNGNLLSLLKLRFVKVRPLSSQEATVYISESFWNNAFARREDVLDQPLEIHGVTYRIAGVARDSAKFLAKTEIWLPITGRGAYGSMPCMRILGVLQDGMDWRTAQTELARCFDEFIKDQPYGESRGAKLMPLDTSIYFRDPLPSSVASTFKVKGQSSKT